MTTDKGNTWEVTVVIEFPVDGLDVTERAPGDAEIDFAHRAVAERLKPALEVLRARLGVSGRSAHWGIKSQPDGALARRCWS